MQTVLTQVPPTLLALDDRGLESLLRETVCERWAGLARTNHNRVEFPGHGHRYNFQEGCEQNEKMVQ
jgi:hypothetical protein